MRTKTFAILILFFALVSFCGDKAIAWGPITHMTILDDILKDPRLDPKVKRILQDNLKYAKGGVVGPDMFYFNNKRYSDIAHYCSTKDLARKMLELAEKNGDPRKIAFAYGWMIHVVTDSVGHPWVNSVTGVEYDPNNPTIKKEHSHIEQSIDKKNYIEHARKLTDPITGEAFAYYYDMDIDSPDIFISEVFSNIFGCPANAPPPYMGEDAENVSQLLYHLYPTWIMQNDENQYNTAEYRKYYQDSITEGIRAINSSGGTLENWDLDTGEPEYKVINGERQPNTNYGGYRKCREYGKLKDCGPVTRTGPGGDHPDDKVSLGSGSGTSEASSLDSLYRLASKKGKKWVLWLKAIKDANAEYSNLPLEAPAESRKEKLDKLSSLASQLNDPFNFLEFSIKNSQIQDEIKETPDIAVLQNGFFEEMATLINKHHEPVRIVNPIFDPEIHKIQPVLIVPSGGLYGMEKSEFFKASLEEYVKQGGTIIVFTQQHGYEFSVLPVPQEPDGSINKIGGYGWLEDVSCFAHAAFIEAWHPILASQALNTPSVHLDGYFVTYPSNAQVILRRTVNGQPVLLMYAYGQGRVILTSMYTDFALKQNQASSEEIALVRDMISWAKRPAGLPEIRPGGAVTVSVQIKNITPHHTASVKLLLYNPSRSALIAEQTVSLLVPPKESVVVPITYPTSSTSPLGIYYIDYILFDVEGNIIQPLTETDSGRFVVSKPPRFYSQFRQMDFSIISDSEQYIVGGDVNFTILAFNRSNEEKTITAKYGKQSKVLVIPPQGMSNFTYSRTAVGNYNHWGQLWDAEQVSFYKEGAKIGAVSKWYRVFLPSASVSVQTDRKHYAKGETVTLHSSLSNQIPFSWSPNVKVAIYNAKNINVFEESKAIILPPSGLGTVSTSYRLPSELPVGTYSVHVEVLLSDIPWIIQTAWTSFELPQTRISVSPNLPTSLNSGINVIPVIVQNTGKIDVYSGTIDVSLKDPDGTIVYLGSELFNLALGETKTLEISIPIPPPKLGTYVLSYSQSDETRVGKPTHLNLPNAVAVSLSLDKISSKIRETAHLTVEVTNKGKFNLENISVVVSSQGIGYKETKMISLRAGSSETQLDFPIPIHETVSDGYHRVEGVLNFPSGSSLKNITYLSVPASALKISYSGASALRIGELVHFNITNTGGKDTDINYEVTLAGNNVRVFQNSADDSIQVKETKSYHFQIPPQITDGNYGLVVNCLDKKTNHRVTLKEYLMISGLSAGLTVRTDKEIYLSSENIGVFSQLVNQSYPIENGHLHLEIINQCRSGMPVSYHILIWDGASWVERATLHYPNLFETRLIDLSGFLPDFSGEYKVRIRHVGEQNAEIDHIGLVVDGVFYDPHSAFNLNTDTDIWASIREGDNWPAQVLNNEIEVQWTGISASKQILFLMRAQEGEREYSHCGERIYWQAVVPITQASHTTLNLSHLVPPFYESGQFYLQGRLVSKNGQVIDMAKHRFNLVNGNLALRFHTDKSVYKPGEPIHITGDLVNLGLLEANHVSVLFYTDDGSIPYQRTFHIPPKGNQSFDFTLNAGPKGSYQLIGRLIQNMMWLDSVSEKYGVDLPHLEVTVDAPFLVGKDLFPISISLMNSSKLPMSIHLSITGGSLSDSQPLFIAPNETRFIQYIQSINSDTSYTVNLSGDFTDTIIHTVVYGLKTSLQFGNGHSNLGLFPEGIVSVPITVTNAGQLGETIKITYQLNPGDLRETRIYHLAIGMSLTDLLYFNLAEGDYKVTAIAEKPDAFAEAHFSVKKENQLDLILSLDSQPEGLLSFNIELMNLGFNEMNGTLTVSVIGESGQIVWNGEEVVSQLASETSQAKRIHFNPSSIDAGLYTFQTQVLNHSNQLLISKNQSFVVQGPAFQITQLPPYQIFMPGQEAKFIFRVKNTGNQEGTFDLRLKSYDLIDSTQREWLKPGEEKAVTFSFMFPEDLEGKDYFANYELKDSRVQGVEGSKGQIKYHLAGINLNVNATLDKPYYNEGETARLTINIQTSNPAPQNLFTRVNYAGFEPQQTFTLNSSQVLIFDVPLPQITGEKLFYGIYHESGRSIHLNSLYIHKTGEVITISTNKQVYQPRDIVSVTVSGSTSGDMTLSGPGGYTETFTFTGSATKSFILPSTIPAGTYFINVELMTQNSSLITAVYPFDMAGIQVKILECHHDKNRYAPHDIITTTLTIASNTTMPARLKAWIVDPAGEYSTAGEQMITLSSTENIAVTFQSVAMATQGGIYRFVFGIYGPEDLLLCSGSEVFDMGGTILLGISTNKKDYPTPTEPVIITASLLGTGDAELRLELDGIIIKTETLSLEGKASYAYELQDMMPGFHSLKATLMPLPIDSSTGRLESVQEIRFTYALPSIPKPNILLSSPYLDFGRVNLGSTSIQTLSLSSSGNTDLRIGTIRLTESLQGELRIQNDTCSGRTIIPSGNCTLEILLSPTSLGLKSGSLVIPSNATDMTTIYLSIHGTAITTLTVVINPEGSGRVIGTGIDCPGDCIEYFSTPTVSLQLFAIPGDGSQFVNWAGGIFLVENPVTIDMENRRHVTANFTIKTYSIVATSSAGGTITPSGMVVLGHGGSQTFAITPSPGYHIADVKVDGQSVGPLNSFTFPNITSHHTIEALFLVFNIPPIADAGSDQNVITGQVVRLDGSESYDPEGGMITFWWTFLEIPSGSSLTHVSLSDPTSAKPEFTPDVSGTYRLQLVVNDGALDSLSDEVLIHAFFPNVPPNANAGPDQYVYTGNMVQLDGSKSWDPDHGPFPLSYLWSFMAKPSQSLLTDHNIANRNSAYASFIPDINGFYELQLTVHDGDLSSESSVKIMATPPNVPPHSNAGQDKTVYLGGTVTLDGSASYDPDQGPQPLSYLWTFVTVPTGSRLINGNISETETVSPSFTPDIAGTYVLQLMVYDGKDAGFDNVAITVLLDHAPPTLAPVANMTTLWPPNHQMMKITIWANAVDNTGFPVFLRVTVTSNEPQNGLGDGDTSPDWTEPIIDQVNGIITLMLRAERSGRGSGRTYTITITATDPSGNSSQANVEIKVPRNRGGK